MSVVPALVTDCFAGLRWEYRADGAASGPENMQADWDLLERASLGVVACRSYTWDGVWVTLGRFQTPSGALVPGFENVVIRPTGGKAVLHGHDLTIAIAAPFQGRVLRSAYEGLLAPVIAALHKCGLPTELATEARSRQDEGPSCFASTSPYDVTLQGLDLKAAGAALRWTREAVLLQASIPYREPLVSPSSVIRDAKDAPVPKWDPSQFPTIFRSILIGEGWK